MKSFILTKVKLYKSGAFAGNSEREELYGCNNEDALSSVIQYYKSYCMISTEFEIYLELKHYTDGECDNLKEYHYDGKELNI